MSETARTRNVLLTIIVVVLVGLVLYITAPVTVLFTVAAFLAVLLRPVVAWLDRYMPRPMSMAAVVLGIGALLVGLGTAMYVQVESMVSRLPAYAARFDALVAEVAALASRVGLDVEPTTRQTLEGVVGLLTSWLGSLLSVGGRGLVVLVITLFILTEASMIRRKLVLAFAPDQYARILGSFDSATGKIKNYLTTKTLVSMVTGALTGLVTWALGVDFPFIWASAAFALNFIPNLGSIAATLAPSLLAFVQYEGMSTGLLTLLLLGSTQMLIGNVIEPRIMGRSLSLSPLVVLVSLLFWGWFWGLPGVLLAVPLTAVLKIACQHIRALRTFGLLLGDARAVEAWVAEQAAEPAAPSQSEGEDDDRDTPPASEHEVA